MNDPTRTRERAQEAWLGAQRSRNTVDAYRRDTDEWFAWLDRHGYDWTTASRVEADRFRGWLKHGRRRGGSVADSTLGRKLTALRSFHEYVRLDLEWIDRNPFARVKQPDRDTLPRTVAMDLDEAQRFLAAAAELGPTEHALAQTMLSTGIRVSGACDAEIGDLGMDRGHQVLRVRIKGGRSQSLPLVPAAWDALQASFDGRASGPLFMAERVQMYRQRAYVIVRQVADVAGIDGKRITPHALRRTAASILFDAGVPMWLIQNMFDHKDPRTTMLYNRARLDIDRSPVHTLGELLERSAS